MANRQIFQHEEDLLLNDECKLLEDDANNKTKMFKLETLKNFIAEFVKDKIKSWEYDSLKTEGKSIIESANEIYDTTQKRMVSMEEIDLVTEAGFFLDALAVKELNRNLSAGEERTTTLNGWTVKYRYAGAGYMYVDISRTVSSLDNGSVYEEITNLPFSVPFRQSLPITNAVGTAVIGSGMASFNGTTMRCQYEKYTAAVSNIIFGLLRVA